MIWTGKATVVKAASRGKQIILGHQQGSIDHLSDLLRERSCTIHLDLEIFLQIISVVLGYRQHERFIHCFYCGLSCFHDSFFPFHCARPGKRRRSSARFPLFRTYRRDHRWRIGLKRNPRRINYWINLPIDVAGLVRSSNGCVHSATTRHIYIQFSSHIFRWFFLPTCCFQGLKLTLKGDISLDTPNPCEVGQKALCSESKKTNFDVAVVVFGCHPSIFSVSFLRLRLALVVIRWYIHLNHLVRSKPTECNSVWSAWCCTWFDSLVRYASLRLTSRVPNVV